MSTLSNLELPFSSGAELFGPVPSNEEEMLQRLKLIAGRQIQELIDLNLGGKKLNHFRTQNKIKSLESSDPELPMDKGLWGRMIERALGVRESNVHGPDFPHLGIELKTLPIADGKPKESTFVTALSFRQAKRAKWLDSAVYKKLRRILFVPIEGSPKIPPLERRVGLGFLYSPSLEVDKQFEEDFENIMALVSEGYAESLTAKVGLFLQVRPKANNSQKRIMLKETLGETEQTKPLAFYLRRSFLEKEVLRLLPYTNPR